MFKALSCQAECVVPFFSVLGSTIVQACFFFLFVFFCLFFFCLFFFCNCLSSVWRHRENYSCLHYLQISGAVAKFQSKSKPAFIDDIWSKMCGCVRASNGIKVLLSLLMVKTPLVDADCIRSLACKALRDLSRSEKIREVIGKLQLFISGQLQSEYCTARCFFHACAIMYIIQLGVPAGKMKLVLCSDRLPKLLFAWDITLLSSAR